MKAIRSAVVLCLSSFIFSPPATAARIQVAPFRVYSINSYPNLGKRLGDLLLFRLGLTTGIRATGIKPARGNYRRIRCSTRITRTGITVETSIYFKNESIPENRFTLRAESLTGIYNLVEQTARRIILRLPGRYRLRRGALLDIVYCLDSSGSMHRHVPDFRRSILETMNSLERTLAHTRLHSAVVLLRSGKVITSTPLGPKRYPILKAVSRLNAWSRPGRKRSIATGLRTGLINRSWRSKAVKIAVLFSNNPGSRYLHGLGRSLARKGIKLIVLVPFDTSAAAAATLREFARTTSGVALDAPVLISWRWRKKRGSFFWERGRIYRFRNPVGAGRIPFIRPELMRFDNGVRIFRATTLPEALRIATGSRTSRIIMTGSALARSVSSGLRTILAARGIRMPGDLPRGRILLESNGLRFWTDVTDASLLRRLRYYKGTGVFWLGVHPVPAPYRQYRFLLHPGMFLLPHPGTRIAELAQADAVRFTRNPHFYSRNGLLKPARWFMRVKLHKMEKYRLGPPALRP